MTNCDFLVIGGGIIGISIARELKKRHPDCKIILLEKEKQCGLHASGRNSGVLHAGFYYSSDSLKARFTRQGNKQLNEYCQSKNLKINKCGKLVVAQNEAELDNLEELFRRGKQNGVSLNKVSEAEAQDIEPRVKTYGQALFSPTTATVDPVEVLSSLHKDIQSDGIEVKTGEKYIGRNNNVVQTQTMSYSAGYIINSAGLYADVIGKDFGFSQKYSILPFKGLYLYSDEPPGTLKTNIYPVPNLRNPFLGTHFTVTVDGKSKIGPTAIPAFWREHYDGLNGFKLEEFVDIFLRQASLFTFSQFDFKQLAWEEIQKYYRPRLVNLASNLLKGVQSKNYKYWGKTGIRAQLLNVQEKKLEMDFVLEGDSKSFHVLNAVSPGFTCAFPFAEYICDEITRLTQ
ncbi:MAG: L-2-hydroxyglutarate oxidase [Nitrosomonadaceae bacterium]|nr:L-2-hydroxyglutarate oxidase [Nitrosomonadaceae bacterium]|tara:strand:- start:2312 stop:3511 length:1200 start_codon:yes stop_codon:yes gene_type:complete